jgi:hypothetical protein
LVLVAQLVGEPRPDLVVLENRKLHVLENLGGFAFVERGQATPFGVTADATRIFSACLNLPTGTSRTMVAATRQAGSPGPLLICPIGASCFTTGTFNESCVDAVGGHFAAEAFDELVVATPSQLGILQGNLLDAMTYYALGETGLAPVFHTSDGTPFYGSYEADGEWRLFHLPDNEQWDAVGQSFISNIVLTSVELPGYPAMLAGFDDSMNGPELELIDVHDGGTFLRGAIAKPLFSTQRLIGASFSTTAALERGCAIASNAGEVDRWQLVPNGPALAFTNSEKLYSAPAADLASADLDGDGLEDLVIAPANAMQLVILKGR